MYERQHVKVFFKNGLTCEGIVIQWENNQAFLCAPDSENLLHLYDTSEVLMVMVFAAEMNEEEYVMEPLEEEFYVDPPEVHEPRRRPSAEAVDYKREAQPIVEPPPPQVNFAPGTKHELRLKKLAELRGMQREALKEQVANRMRDHRPTNVSTSLNPYDNPSFTKPVPQNRPAAQSRRRVRKNS